MKRSLTICLLSMLVMPTILCYAQKSISGRAVYYNKSVILRWVPLNKTAWQQGNSEGYKIYRVTLKDTLLKDTSIFARAELLNKEALRPWSKESNLWKNLISKEPNAVSVYQAIYGDPNPDETLFGLTLISCDLSKNIAKAHGLYFRDTTAKPNTIYAYKVEAVGLKTNSWMIVVSTHNSFMPYSLSRLTGNVRNTKVELSWPTPDSAFNYSAYNIERSSDNNNYKRINDVPFVQIRSTLESAKPIACFTDTITAYGTYFYRIKGITWFAEEGPASNVVRIKRNRTINTYPLLDSLSITNNKLVSIFWKMPNDNPEADLKGFVVERSGSNEGKYSVISAARLDNKTKSFTDESPLFTNYYRVGAISLDGDTVYSFPHLAQLKDNEPPATPEGLKGIISDSGIVSLRWKQNQEKDLMAYRVFRTNNLKEEFVEVKQHLIKDTYFSDTINLNTLTEDIYYCLTAVDKNYNNSIYSEPLKLKRPDKIPPVPVVFKTLRASENGISITWGSSTSNDVVKAVLSRKSNRDSSFIKLKEVAPLDTNYLDTNALQGFRYHYRIQLFDEVQNASVSQSYPLFYELGYRKKIDQVHYVNLTEEKAIRLNWSYAQEEVERYVIYKALKGHLLRICASVEAPTQEYIDKDVYPNESYQYCVKAVFWNGIESIVSDVIETNFKHD